jgi:hypothetical protein
MSDSAAANFGLSQIGQIAVPVSWECDSFFRLHQAWVSLTAPVFG